MRRRPTVNTASGSSVMASTTTSPRTPCAFRILPTMIGPEPSAPDPRAEPATATLSRLRVGLLGQRNSGGAALAAEALFVARLEDAGAPKERADGVGGLGAVVEPVVDAVGLEIERVL